MVTMGFSKCSLWLSTIVAVSLQEGAKAFVPFTIKRTSSFLTFRDKLPNAQNQHTTKRLYMSAVLPEISTMKIGELKKELESYGISTKSFFEKNELVVALEKARTEGKRPISSPDGSCSTYTTSSSSSSKTEFSRDQRLAEEMEKCKTMKASELKSELKSYGIPTNSFFEKSEFVKACAEARVDGTSNSGPAGEDEESYAEYANVEVLTSDAAGPRKRSQEDDEKKQGSGMPGGNPFGGGMPGGMGGMGGMPGGMGGMGDMGEMLKNMGMGGMGGGGFGGGGNPFGGGGMPGGGDTMKKAQEMMSNPKVREIMAKAQSNPKVMAAMTECMSNPAAFAKYQNDPEVGSLLRELQQFM